MRKLLDKEEYGNKYDPGLTWDLDLIGVIILGDAAHVMSPFAGEGVNQGYTGRRSRPRPHSSVSVHAVATKSLCLIFSLVIPADFLTLVKVALRKYEKRIMRRARKVMRESENNQEIVFGGKCRERIQEED
nr:hypothetical protein L203_05428 [Cryptococcus depauperatus CBS 7841]